MIPKYSGTVLVAGATGRTGQQIVINLQRRGISYRLFVRSAEKARSLFGNDVEGRIVAGSAENPDDIRRAVEGIDAVICAIGGAVTDPEAPPPSAIDRDAIIRLASMAKQSGAKQFILISSLAVTKPDHPLNKYGRVLDMKLEGENGIRKLFKDEGHTYTIIRPGGLLDGPPMQHGLLLDTGDRITGSIDRSDVAEIAVLALIVPAAGNRTFELIRQDEAPQDSLNHYFDLLL